MEELSPDEMILLVYEAIRGQFTRIPAVTIMVQKLQECITQKELPDEYNVFESVDSLFRKCFYRLRGSVASAMIPLDTLPPPLEVDTGCSGIGMLLGGE